MDGDVRPHTAEWYQRIARLHGGYAYPWKSRLGEGNAEDAYTALVLEHLSDNIDVADCGCGHGTDVLWIARHVRSVAGYDQVPQFIALAEAERQTQGISNARFVVADSSPPANDGVARMPLAACSVDLFVSRRGPTSWISDAPRVARPGATLLQLNPSMGPLPSWTKDLPMELRPEPYSSEASSAAVLNKVASRLRSAGLSLHSHWDFDSPEWLYSPRDLYEFLAWGRDPARTPQYSVVSEALHGLFGRYANALGLEQRRCGVLWKALA